MSVLHSTAPSMAATGVPVLYADERIGAWWPGISRNCPHCGGLLFNLPPDENGLGRVADIQCEREVYEVRATRRPAYAPEAEKPQVGRPPGGGTAHAAKHCADCGSRLGYDNTSGYCSAHYLAHRSARAKAARAYCLDCEAPLGSRSPRCRLCAARAKGTDE